MCNDIQMPKSAYIGVNILLYDTLIHVYDVEPMRLSMKESDGSTRKCLDDSIQTIAGVSPGLPVVKGSSPGSEAMVLDLNSDHNSVMMFMMGKAKDSLPGFW